MSVTVTRTKILLPKRRPDLLSRSRLISMLDDVLDYPFTLISAPAGYGKTSLMIDLAHQASYPVCWYSIDPLDLDPNRFLTYFIQAIQVQFPDFGGTALSLLENQANPLLASNQVIGQLINEIYQTISEHFVLFLDDFHHLNSEDGICSFISQFGQQMDDNMHLVLASRTRFDFPDLPLLIGRRLVKGIGFDELAFQTNEIKSYYQDILKREISDREIENLWNQTEGWITGLVFSIDAELDHLPGTLKKGQVTSTDLFQYLAEQVFEKQSPAVQNFLLQSSLFDEFNEDLCDQVFDRRPAETWADLITLLQENNLFIQQFEDQSTWIRYHTLFRDFLRARIHQQQPELEIQIITRMLEVHRKTKSWEKAFLAACELGNPQIMAAVIEQASSSLIHQGRIKLLSSWLEALPEEGFDFIPKLLILRGISFISLGNPKQGLTYFNQIINKPEISENPDLYTRALLCRITSSRLLGYYSEALADIEYIDKEVLLNPISNNLLAEVFRESALAHLNLGNYKKSRSHFFLALKSYSDLEDKNNQALVHQDLGLLLMDHGCLQEADQHFETARIIWKNSENLTLQSTIHNNIGNLLMLFGNYRESTKMLEYAGTFSKQSSNLRMIAFVTASQGDLAKSISQYQIAELKYCQANILSEQISEGYLLTFLALSRAQTYRYMNKITICEEYLEIANTYIMQSYSLNDVGNWHLEHGFYLFEEADFQSSRESFLKAEKIFFETEKPVELAKAQLGLALVSQSQSQPEDVHAHVQDWRASLKALESWQPLLPELYFQGENLHTALKDFLSDPVFVAVLADLDEYRQNLPRLQRDIFPEQKTDPLSSDSLEICALGKNLVRRQGINISAPEWIYQKTAREIFFYLLTLPRGASKEQIGLVFWPDSSPAQLTCQFKNAIYRLRRSLGREAILYDHETRKYLFNQDQSYSYDVEDFFTAIRKAKRESEPSQRIEYFHSAVNIYRHPYAPQVDGVWAEPIRQKLSREYEQALLEIAAYLLNQNQTQDCLTYCRKALEIDPCQEKVFQLGFYAFAQENDRANLVRFYNKCKKNLNEQFQLDPSAETTNLFRKLIK